MVLVSSMCFKSTYESPPIIDVCKGTFYTISANTCCSLEAEISQPVFTQRTGFLPSCLLTGLWVIDSCREAQCCVFMAHCGSGVCSSFRTTWNFPGIFHHWDLLHHPQESNSDFCLAAITLASLSSQSSLGHLLQHFSESLFLVDTPLSFLCMVLPELQTHCNLASPKAPWTVFSFTVELIELLLQNAHSLLSWTGTSCAEIFHESIKNFRLPKWLLVLLLSLMALVEIVSGRKEGWIASNHWHNFQLPRYSAQNVCLEEGRIYL